MPRELGYLEKPLRERIRERVQRGSLQILIELVAETPLPGRLQVDVELARDYVKQVQKLRDELGLAGEVNLHDLLQLPELFTVKEPESAPEEITQMATAALDQALANLLAMRQAEGAALQADLIQRLDACLEMVNRIAALAPRVPEQYRERLRQRLSEILDAAVVDEDRLHKEVAWFADKADVCEELTRLRCHLEQVHALLLTDEPVGRKLDFLLQEMNREINTIGSKANDQEIAQMVVDVKAELERMREQVQNLQ